jgi:anti-sigma factor RsiW
MCDFSKKLVAWMDGELPQNESETVARHVESCPECRDCVASFEQASNSFDTYCEMAFEQVEAHPFAVSASNPKLQNAKLPGRKTVLWGAGAVAAAVIAMLIVPPRRQMVQAPSVLPVQSASARAVEKTDSPEAANPGASPIAVERHNRPHSRLQKSRAAKSITSPQRPRVAESQGIAFAAGPPIEISVPAEDMFPPGAVPDGISYTAVVTFAADDAPPRYGNASINGLKTGFGRGGNRP